VTGGLVSTRINDVEASMWQTLSVHENDVVSFGKMITGCRAYLAVRGGIDVPQVLGSRSTYTRGGFGGIEGRPLKAGDIIDGFATSILKVECSLPIELVPEFSNRIRISVSLGPQADMFTNHGLETFLSDPYKVTPEADRMGYRLEGSPIQHKTKADIVSDALLPGAVQVPKNGQPIVIMRDAQTTGGYAKIAVALSSDLDMIGQAKPNDTIEFTKVSLRQAYEKLRAYEKRLDSVASAMIKRTSTP
jgi:biotin-dependent carboxylase-like uncharacterized protein